MPLYYFMSKWFLAPQRIRTSICGLHLFVSTCAHTVSWICGCCFFSYLGNLWHNILKMRLHRFRMRRKEWRKDVWTTETKKSNKITENQCVSHLFVYFLSHFGLLTLFVQYEWLCGFDAINISSQSFRGWPIDEIIICIKYLGAVCSSIIRYLRFRWVYNWKLYRFEVKWW